MRTREEDFVSHLFVASTHAYIMIFSDRGRAYWLKVHEIPDVGPDGRGKAIANLVSMEEGERIAALLRSRSSRTSKFIVMGTQRGVIKKTELSPSATRAPAASSPWRRGRRRGHRRADLRRRTARSSSARATAWRSGFRKATCARWVAAAYGVRGISLRDEDSVVTMQVLGPTGTILSVTEQGYGKRTALDEYRVQSRGGVGSSTFRRAPNGQVIGVIQVGDDDALMLITQAGQDPEDGVEGHPQHRSRDTGRAAHRHRRR
jgi:DNA gyrase subunit A